MTWEVGFNEDLQIVELVLSGHVAGPEFADAAAARIAMGQEKGITNFLIDAGDMVTSRSATVGVFQLPTAVYPEKKMGRDSHLAVLVPKDPGSIWVADFFEDICVNRGWHVQTFTDRNTAIDWLQEK